MKRLLLLASLLSLPSCMISLVDSNVCEVFNEHEAIIPTQPATAKESVPSSQWALARSEVLEFANEKGELIYYVPVKVTWSHAPAELFRETKFLWPLPFSLNRDYIPYGDKTARTGKQAVMYYPLHTGRAIALLAPESKMMKGNDFPCFFEGEQPASYRLVRRVNVPNLKTQLYRLDYNPPSFYYPDTEYSVLNRMGYWSTAIVVDTTIEVIASIVKSVYNNTLGLPSTIKEAL